MGKKKSLSFDNIYIEKLVQGGQGMGILPDGKKCFVWGALPDEVVNIKVIKNKKDWADAIVTDVIKPSKFRIQPQEPDMYLSTSPWQIMEYSYEQEQKQEVLQESFAREGLDKIIWAPFYFQEQPFEYRNKMEYNFWYDNEIETVSLALHRRGSHLKIAVDGSALASTSINKAGQDLIDYINNNKIEARLLKSVIIRSDGTGKVGISLFVNDKFIASQFSKFIIQYSIFEVVYSNPKSPASVATEILLADTHTLTDIVNGREFKYSTRSFFQVNIPVYEKVLDIIAKELETSKATNILDLYSGVGSIGLSVVGDNQHLTMLETDAESTNQAITNLANRRNSEVITATAESAIIYINNKDFVIIDPPRAGLHKDVTAKLIEQKPKTICYLSCNPATQARDVKALVTEGYCITYAQGFNFFPRTPHVESLVVLVQPN